MTVRDSVGIKEAVREWVFQEGVDVGGSVSLEVGRIVSDTENDFVSRDEETDLVVD